MFNQRSAAHHARHTSGEQSAQKTMAKNIQTANEVKEESQLRQVRNAIAGYYARTAWDVFTMFVDVNESELAEFKRVTNDATTVFTQPTAESLQADRDSGVNRFVKGRSFGSVQWYKVTQVVEDATNIVRSYNSFVRYMDSKEHAEERDEKKLAAAAAVLGITLDELKALKKK